MEVSHQGVRRATMGAHSFCYLTWGYRDGMPGVELAERVAVQ